MTLKLSWKSPGMNGFKCTLRYMLYVIVLIILTPYTLCQNLHKQTNKQIIEIVILMTMHFFYYEYVFNECFFFISVAEFAQRIAAVHEAFATQLHEVVDIFKKRSKELKAER